MNHIATLLTQLLPQKNVKSDLKWEMGHDRSLLHLIVDCIASWRLWRALASLPWLWLRNTGFILWINVYIYTKSNVIRITSHLWVQKGTHLIYFSWNGLQFRSHHKPCCSALPSGDPCIANHLGHVPKTSAGWLETTGSSFELRWREKNAGQIHKPSQLRFGKTTFI